MEEKNTSFRFDFGGVISAASGEQVQPAGHTTAAVVPAKEVIVPVVRFEQNNSCDSCLARPQLNSVHISGDLQQRRAR